MLPKGPLALAPKGLPVTPRPQDQQVGADRKKAIDGWVEGNAAHEQKVLGLRWDSQGGTRVGEALNGKSALGQLTPAERRYLADKSVAKWETLDPAGRNENIREAGQALSGNPEGRTALAQALAAPAVSEDRAIKQAGAIITAPGTTQRHGEMLAAAMKLDLGAVAQQYKGLEVEFAKRLSGADSSTRQTAWKMLGEPGRLPQDQQQKLTTALFFMDKGAKDTGPEYRRNIADAIALARRPGNTDADRLARHMISMNLSGVMETRGGRDMLLNPENSPNARLWGLNEIASQTGCIDVNRYAGFDAPGLANAPDRPLDPKSSQSTPSQGDVMADLAQMGLDVAGIFDPTPTSDGINAVVSLFRGDIGGAALSAVGMVPYLGDAAKLGKLGKWAKTVANATELAARDAAFMKKARPVLEQLAGALKKIPEDVIGKLPKDAQNAIRGMIRKLDDALGLAAKRAPLVVDDALGQASKTLPDGRVLKVGDQPTVNTRPDGRFETKRADGTTVVVREPKTYDAKVSNPDGSVTYTKGGKSVTYDASGFPVFDSRADIYLDAKHINSADEAGHFRAANDKVAAALKNDPSLAGKMGLTPEQVKFFQDGKGFDRAPPRMTWHHHQDTGKMQLVIRDEHQLFPGGHTGGMAIWGGGRD